MTPNDLKARIAARRAEAVERRAIAEAATPGPWTVDDRLLNVVKVPGDFDWVGQVSNRPRDKWCADATHIAANDPKTVIRDQDRIIAGCDADLALLDGGWIQAQVRPTVESLTFEGFQRAVIANLAARYADTEGGAV